MFAPVTSTGDARASATSDSSVPRLTAPAQPSLNLTAASAIRQSRPDDRQFLTVEPDGRDDIGFLDRLRHALRTVFEAVQSSSEAELSAERALQSAESSLDPATLASDSFYVQLRVVGVEVAYADGGGDAAYASYRRLGLEIGVARGGSVRADDTRVVDLEGRAVPLTRPQTLTGLSSGVYRRIETAETGSSGAAGDRLAEARAGLARVKAMQGALQAYRSGDVEPLKNLLENGDAASKGRFTAVFPGVGALTIN